MQKLFFWGLALTSGLSAGPFDPLFNMLESDKGLEFIKRIDTKKVILAAVQADRQNVVDFLLIHGSADVETKDEHGNTLLHLACIQGRIKVLKILLNYRANIEAKNTKIDNGTPLIQAAKTGQIKVLKILLAHSANINAKTKDGKTALEIALMYPHQQFAEILLNTLPDYFKTILSTIKPYQQHPDLWRPLRAQLLPISPIDSSQISFEEVRIQKGSNCWARVTENAAIFAKQIETKQDGYTLPRNYEFSEAVYEEITKHALDIKYGDSAAGKTEADIKDGGTISETIEVIRRTKALRKCLIGPVTNELKDYVVPLDNMIKLLGTNAKELSTTLSRLLKYPEIYAKLIPFCQSQTKEIVILASFKTGNDTSHIVAIKASWRKNKIHFTIRDSSLFLHDPSGDRMNCLNATCSVINNGITNIKTLLSLPQIDELKAINENALEAARTSNLRSLKTLLDQGADITHSNKHGLSLLHFAALQGNQAMTRFLLKHHIDVNAQDSKENTALTFALKKFIKTKDKQTKQDYIKIIEELIVIGGATLGKNKAQTDANGIDIHALQEQREKWLSECNWQTSKINSQNDPCPADLYKIANNNFKFLLSEFTPLGDLNAIVAAYIEDPLKKFNAKKMRINSIELFDFSTDNRGLKLLQQILSEGIYINYQRHTDGNTALHVAAEAGQNDIIKALLTAEFSLNITNKAGKTPLQLAAEKGHTASVKLLLATSSIKASHDNLQQALELALNKEIKELIKTSMDKK